MKKNNTLVMSAIIIIFGLMIFFLMGIVRNNNQMMTAPIKISYPKIEEDVPYLDRIFDTTYMHEINIDISKKDWEDLISNPLAKKKYKIGITVDGIKFKNVSIKTKGNSSLKNIAAGPSEGPASKRFSFKISFNDYEKKQTYYGLDTLHLNNIYGDATYLNDFISYEAFRALDVASPLISFAYIKINGNNFGLYSIVEGIDNSFLKRNHLSGNLYKPEQIERNNSSASLIYTDDNPVNYANIINSAQTIITNEDQKRLIRSIKKLNLKEELESTLNVDEIIHYFAVHNYLLNYDSYTGKSIHNYYLLENEGVLSMLPWDYNLSFGRFNMIEDINTIVNYGIDSPLNQVQERRPMWEWIIQDEKYKKKYHETMNNLITNYFESNNINNLIDSIYNVLKPYMESDVSFFYTSDQISTAIETLKKFCLLRTKSIQKQLEGKLSTDTLSQKKEDRIDATTINLENMGLVAVDRKRESANKEEK